MTSGAREGDPRQMATGGGEPVSPREEAGVMPIVGVARGGPSWLFFAVLLIGLGVVLFNILDARRQTLVEPAVKPSRADRAAFGVESDPPPLYVPPAVPTAPPPAAQTQPVSPQPAPERPVPAPQPQIVYVPQPAPPQAAPAAPPARSAGEPVLVYDGGPTEAPATGTAPAATAGPPAAAGPAADGAATTVAGTRVRSGVFANPSGTVVQGTLIPAVLETGLNSTLPGLARAMVTRDIRGFDGRRVLIPRGSRLIGEYRAQIAPGQNRAFVNWLRLIRPDGVTIAIGSPASDPLGGTGVRGRVNTHFFERFLGAILQSSLDIGVNLASRPTNGAVIVALPTAREAAAPLTRGRDIAPTIKVRAGTSIAVFVARDLEFGGAARLP